MSGAARGMLWAGGLGAVVFVLRWAAYDSAPGPWLALGLLSAGLIVAGLTSGRRALRATLQTRGFRYSFGALALTLLALSIAAGVNAFVARYDTRWDVTEGKRYTLSDETILAMAALETPVQLQAFFPDQSAENAAFQELVAGYTAASSQISVEFHDPMAEPYRAREYEVTNVYGTVILEADGAQQRLETEFDEAALTNAILRLTSGESHLVCFSKDHGEASPEDGYEPTGLAVAADKLTGQGYTVELVSLIAAGGVSADCDALIIARPQVDLLSLEREAIASFVRDGGAVFWMLQSLMVDATAADLVRYGVQIGNDIVLEDNPEARMMGLDPSFVLVTPDALDFHPVTDEIKGQLLFQAVRSVELIEEVPAGLRGQIIARSSPGAWAERTLGGESAAPDSLDIVGSVPFMVAIEVDEPGSIVVGSVDLPPLEEATPSVSESAATPTPAATSQTPVGRAGGKVLVVGDATFASNQLLLQGSNLKLWLESVAWLVGEKRSVAIPEADFEGGKLEMNQAQTALVWLGCVLFFPGVALAFAGSAWARRRKL